MILVGIAFGSVAIAHLVADFASISIHDSFSSILSDNPGSSVKYLSSLEKSFFWIVVIATALGVGMSFTKAKEYEGAGASKLGSIFLYILVATIGMK